MQNCYYVCEMLKYRNLDFLKYYNLDFLLAKVGICHPVK